MVEPLIEIEVVHAGVERQKMLAVAVPLGSSVRSAVLACGMGEFFPELDLQQCLLGIFGKVVVDPDVRQVRQGERVEIYRPLLADPKEIRRLRAAKAALARARDS